MLYCISQCNAAATCAAFRYEYGSTTIGEPTDATETQNPAAGIGMCYLKQSQGTAVANASPTANWMSRIARAAYTSPAVTSSTVVGATSSTNTGNNVATGNPTTTTTTTTTPAVPTTTTTTTTANSAYSSSPSSNSASSSAQAAVGTVTPTGAWRPGPTCSAGGDLNANGGLGGGGYVDRFGGLWDTRCSNTLPNGVPVGNSPSAGTNGQGWYGCAKGCARRPGCTAFQFDPNYVSGTVPRSTWGDTVGSGNCLYFSAAGAYSPGDPSTLYGAAHLIRANTQLPVSHCQPV